MNADVRCWARTCVQCQRVKNTRHTITPHSPFRPPDSRFAHVHIDLVGPLPSSRGARYLLTCVDRFTRWPEAFPVPDMTAKTVATAFIDGWVSRFGCPAVVTTDRGRQFQSSLFAAFVTVLGVRHIHTTSYHPSANGMVERLHRQLKAALATYEPRERSANHLPLVLLGLRSALKADLGCSAAELVYGKPLRLPGEFFSPPSSESREDPSGYIDDLRQTFRLLRPVLPAQRSHRHVFVSQDLETCSHVFLRRDQVRRPLEPAYDGPFRVLNRQAKTFTLDLNGRRDVVTTDRVKPAYLEAISPTSPASAPSPSAHSALATRTKHITWTLPGPTAPQGFSESSRQGRSTLFKMGYLNSPESDRVAQVRRQYHRRYHFYLIIRTFDTFKELARGSCLIEETIHAERNCAAATSHTHARTGMAGPRGFHASGLSERDLPPHHVSQGAPHMARWLVNSGDSDGGHAGQAHFRVADILEPMVVQRAERSSPWKASKPGGPRAAHHVINRSAARSVVWIHLKEQTKGSFVVQGRTTTTTLQPGRSNLSL
ncbi:Transposon Tf2-9 polyprotein [Ixodes scapularis]